MWLPPRRLLCSLISIYQVVFPPRPPNTRNWPVREMHGGHQSSISARPRQHPTSLPRRRSPGNLLINTLVPQSTIEKARPLIKVASILKVATVPQLANNSVANSSGDNNPVTNNTIQVLHSTAVPLTPQATLLSTKNASNPLLDPGEDLSPPATTAATDTNPA